MLNESLMVGWSRGINVLGRSVRGPTVSNDASMGRAEGVGVVATRGDLISALRFPMAPGWILQGSRRINAAMPGRAGQPGGCA